MARITTDEEQRAVRPRAPGGHGLVGKLAAVAAVIVAIAVLIVALAAVNLLPGCATRSVRPRRCAAGPSCSSRSPR